jgi:hypothetical protein
MSRYIMINRAGDISGTAVNEGEDLAGVRCRYPGSTFVILIGRKFAARALLAL